MAKLFIASGERKPLINSQWEAFKELSLKLGATPEEVMEAKQTQDLMSYQASFDANNHGALYGLYEGKHTPKAVRLAAKEALIVDFLRQAETELNATSHCPSRVFGMLQRKMPKDDVRYKATYDALRKLAKDFPSHPHAHTLKEMAA